jgi:hypothetical protein
VLYWFWPAFLIVHALGWTPLFLTFRGFATAWKKLLALLIKKGSCEQFRFPELAMGMPSGSLSIDIEFLWSSLNVGLTAY